jgi:lactate dehydrogenase-like 2-hydroxyacid dehydrogenase
VSRPVITVTRRLPAEVEDMLVRRWPDVRPNPTDAPYTLDGLRAAMQGSDVLLSTITDPLTAAAFDRPVRTRLIAQYGAGVDNIDLDAAAARGIAVRTTPDALTSATADLAMLLMLSVARRAGPGERLLRAGRWQGWSPTDRPGRDLTGRTLGVVGMGRIGRAVAARARTWFAMPLVHCSPSGPRPDLADARWVPDVDALLAASDVVSLHAPATPGRRPLIGARELARMRPGAILINTARGSLVDHRALAAAVRSGALAGAGLDVYPDEPAVPPELLDLDEVTLLPHMGSATAQARAAMGRDTIGHIETFLAEAGEAEPGPGTLSRWTPGPT